ncbi:MAG: hypothetical protein DSZ13_03325 [Candidatus Thioglobus sp.]|nr:MAG: hypothetical protein DSZ13_03325 [Candidatus Thioglobus sp.]
MKKITLSVALLFLSFSVFSASSVYTAQDDTALRSDKSPNSKVLKVLVKDTKLQRLTMHYSGWSKVKVNDLSGWILSDKLTKIAANKPTKSIVISNNKYAEQIKNLEMSLAKLQLENRSLSSTITDIKAFSADSSAKYIADLALLEQQNTELSTHNNEISNRNNDLQSKVDSIDTDNLMNTLFILIFGLIIGFILSLVIARSAQKKRDSFNTISRSY